MPFLLLVGNDDEAIFDFIQSNNDRGRLLNQSMDFEIYRNGEKTIVGGFDRQWNLSQDAYFDYSKGSEMLVSTNYFDIHSHKEALNKVEASALSEIMLKSMEGIVEFVGAAKSDLQKIALHVYPSAEDKGCLLYTSPSPRDATLSRMPSSA